MELEEQEGKEEEKNREARMEDGRRRGNWKVN
jgi:hypothetical protein